MTTTLTELNERVQKGISALKAKRVASRYNRLENKELWHILDGKMFDLAAYAIKNHEQNIADKDLNHAMIFLQDTHHDTKKISKNQRQKRRKDIFSCYDALTETKLDERVNEYAFQTMLYVAATNFDKELLERLLELPVAMNIKEIRKFNDYTLYYFLPEKDERRQTLKLDKRGSALRSAKGHPELLKVIDDFHTKRLAHKRPLRASKKSQNTATLK